MQSTHPIAPSLPAEQAAAVRERLILENLAQVKLIASRCTEPESGGRMIDAILTNTLLPEISREFLTRLSQSNPTTTVRVGVRDSDFEFNFT